MDTTEGTGNEASVARNAPRGSVVCLGNKEPLLSGAQRVGPPPPPHASSCPVPGRNPTGESMPQSVATACHCVLPLALHTYPSCGCHAPPEASVTQSAPVSLPPHLGGEQTLEGSAHAEVGPKPKISPGLRVY